MTEANVSATPTWHAEDAAAVVAEVATDPQRGLSADVARGRLLEHGPNRLAEVPPPHPLLRFARQFHHLLIYVLLGAAGITALLAQWVDSGVIVAVVLLNAVVGFIQEGKAERSLQAIRHLLAPRAQVLRDGRQHDVDAADLVPGDVVLLASGDRVPADVRLLQTRNLRVDEAALTGESVPVDKNAEAVAVDAAIGDRLGMAYAGTLVTQGQARAVVVATGERTEIGRIGRLLETVEAGPTPLLRKMAAFGRMLTFVILALAAALFAFGTWVRGYAAADMFMAAVGLAVAAIPEGLPAIMTITLAIGVQRMAARHAIVRRMPAVETLGSVTVICSDKTGTLTRNEMTVQAVVVAGAAFTVDGAGYAPQGAWRGVTAGEPLPPAARQLAQASVLCNDAALHEHDGQWTLAGDPTEGALLTLAMKAGADPAVLRAARPRLDVVPFESEHRYMATLHRASDDAAHVAYVKGAPERLLQMCATQLDLQGNRQALDTGHWQSQIDAQARAGRRLLALALVDLPAANAQLAPADVQHGLTLLGLVGIIDPPRDEAIRAVAQCREAGISVKMITGDHAVTAAAIAGQLGLADDGAAAVTGAQIETCDDASLRELAVRATVFARASPEHKLRLVRALQAEGHVVAMTGDGVNDAPALKQADVGVAMGRKGTEAAKQAGAIVLADDNFASIAHAVEEGRTVYTNLRKVVTFLLPVNGGESLSLLVAVLAGVALPILPGQILWVNMVSSVALAMVLAFEPTEADTMRRPPRRPNEPILSRFLAWRIGLVSVLFMAGIFGMFELALARGASVEEARTVAVNTLVAMEIFYLFSVRYLKARSFTWQGVKGTPLVLTSVAAMVLLQAAFTYAPPMQTLFHTQALGVRTVIEIVAVGFSVLVVLEVEKWLRRRFRRHAD
jgi:magnesium-transporting ATPase (P-type)